MTDMSNHPKPAKGFMPPKMTRPLTKTELDALTHALLQVDLPRGGLLKAAMMYGVPYDTLRKRIYRQRKRLASPHNDRKVARLRWSRADYDTLVQMWAKGATTLTIAKKIGRSPSAVRGYAINIGLLREDRKEPPMIKWHGYEEKPCLRCKRPFMAHSNRKMCRPCNRTVRGYNAIEATL